MVHRGKLGRSAFQAALVYCAAAQQNFDYDGSATERVPDKVLGYSFSTLNTAVAQTLRLDLDVAEIGVLMSQYEWEAAQKVFEQGGFSADHAELVFGDPLPRSVAMGETVQQGGGWSKTVGLVKAAAEQGAMLLAIDYTSIWSPCIGASITDPILPGPYGTLQNGSLHCFDTSGDVTVGGDLLGVPTSATSHFMSFSQLGKLDTLDEPSAYLKLYKAYFDREDFATALAFDALHGIGVFENTGHGQFNADAVKKIVQALITWVLVLHQLDLAASKCQQCHDLACRNEVLVEWDKAAALYGGSQWNSLLGGHFLFGLAFQTCRFFGTCDENGQSKSNLRAMQAFNDGKASLQRGDCELSSAEALVAEVSTTLFQNLLLNAYEIAQGRTTSGQASGREYLRGYIFATAVLPLVSYCEPSASNVLHTSMVQSVGQDLEFEAIKSSVESVLACLGIECSDLGVLSIEGHSVSFCNDATQSSGMEIKSELSDSISTVIVIIVAVAVCALGVLGCFCMYKYAYYKGRYSVFEDGVSVMAAASSRDQSQNDTRTIGNETVA